MSTPEPPSGPPAEAGSPSAPAAEPGHRARALAASLLGELTGQRKSGLTFAPLEPTGLAVERTAEQAPAGRPQESPADDAAPAPTPAEEVRPETPAVVRTDPPGGAAPASPEPGGAPTTSAAVPSLAPPAAPRLAAVPSPDVTAPAAAAPAPSDDGEGAEEEDPLDRLAAAATATPVPPVGGPATTPVVAPGPASRPTGPAAEQPRPAQASPPQPTPQQPGPQQPGPQEPTAQQSAAQQPPSSPGAQQQETGTREQAPAANVPSASAALAPQQAATPVRTGREGSGAAGEVRPAPFTYLAVAQHHTTPARATANGALDQAGQRISSRVDRALVRRAAQVTLEASSLLDACDVLDGRARAADATWTGEHHSPTEVREFEGAWGAFYDAQGALAQHVTS